MMSGSSAIPVFDADNHYYEALDAFTRHLDPALGTTGDPVVGDQRPALPRHRRAGQPGGHQPDLRSGGPPRGHVRLLPGQPRRPEPDGVPVPPRTGPARLPGARGPPGRPRRAGHGRVPALPHTRDDLRGTAGPRSRGGLRHVPRLQPVDGRGLDLRLPRPHLRRPLPHPGRSGLGRRGAGLGPRPAAPARWSCGRRRPTTAVGRRNPFDPMFDAFWGLANEAGITVVVHASDSGGSSNGYAVDGFGATFTGRVEAVHQDRSPSNRPSATTC